MAKIGAWEKTIRDEMERFARQINTGQQYAITLHQLAHLNDPENVPEFKDEPAMMNKLVPAARDLFLMTSAVRMAVAAIEEDDQRELDQAMKHITQFMNGMKAELQWDKRGDAYYLTRELIDEKGKESFNAVVLANAFAEYLTHYRDILELGVCRQCENVYLKPKHGRKMRYCTRACAQKAYRKRQKESEG